MHHSWDRAQPDEWLPRSLRLCWGGSTDGGSDGSSGFDSGGGGFTGGGDWGSSGTFDASGFNAGGDTGAWSGVQGIDASVSGPGTGGGDWGSFGATNYAGMNASNPTYADIGGSLYGATTGGGDWGSAGAYSAAGMGGGLGGGLYGGGGGLFGGYEGGAFGGGGGGYTGGGGGGGRGGGEGRGGEGGGGRSSAPSSVSSPYADDTGPSGRGEAEVSSPYADDTGPTGRGEQDTVGPAPEAAPEAEPSDFGKPAEAAPPEGEPAPSQNEAEPAAAAAAGKGSEVAGKGADAASNFGPESVTSHEGRQALSDLTQSALTAQEPAWGSVFEAPTDPAYQNDRGPGPMGPLNEPGPFESLISDIPGVANPSWAQNTPTVSEAMQPGGPLSAVGKAYDFMANLPNTLNPNNWVNVQSPMGSPLGPQTSAMDLQALGEQGRAGQPTDLSSQLGLESVGAPDPTDWGSVFEGAAPAPSEPEWGSVFEAPAQAPDYASVFEGADPFAGINPGAEQYWTPTDTQTTPVEIVPSTELPTNTPNPLANQQPQQPEAQPEAQPQQPQEQPQQTTTDNAATPGSDPALSGYPAEGAPGTAFNDPGVSPDAVANAASNAALNAGVSPQAGDAASQAAQAAAQSGQSLTNVAIAAMGAALEAGATQEQADAIAAAVLNAAVSRSENEVGTTPGAPPAAPTTPQAAPPSLIDMAQPGATRSESFIPGDRTTDFNYPSDTGRGIEPGAEQYGVQPDNHDAPEPQDNQPSQDPNVPRPPGDIPGQPIGSRGDYANARADNPQTNRNYIDSGRLDNPQGEPGVTFRSARQAGVTPLFRTGDIDVGNVDARVVENVNRALTAMEQRTGIPANSLLATSGMRFATRGGAIIHGHDPRMSQESVRSRGNPSSGGGGFPAAPPGRSNHGAGRAIDFSPRGDSGRALTWLRANAGEFGLETLGYKNGKIFDEPHIQLRGGGAGARPSAQEQQAQRVINEQNRQAAIDRGLIGGGRGQAPTQVAQPAAPPGGWRGIGGDIGREARLAPPPAQPDVTLPTALPPPNVPLAPEPAPRPPADIPAPVPDRPLGPNEYDIPVTPAARGRLDPGVLQNIFTRAFAGLGKQSGEAEFNAATVVSAKGLAASGVPLATARNMMTQSAYAGAAKNGYDINSFPMGGVYKGKIDGAIEAALQGYQPARPGEVQGPPSPAQQRSEAPFGGVGHFAAGGRDVGAPPAIEPEQQPGRAEWDTPLPGGLVPNVDPFAGHGIIIDPKELGRGQVIDPDIFPLQQQERDLQQQMFDPRAQQRASLLDFLQNFNPISTAEARSGRSQAANLQAPRADPGTIQSRLSAARSDIVNDLQTNQGLRNTLDLVVTGEVGSQGKAAVLGFLETAMNKVAAEASAQGRAPTGRDLLNYLNNRSYFPDTWGKIDSGKIRGGALTDDLLGAIAAGSNTTGLSTGNSTSKSASSRFGGNPTNVTIGGEHYGVENYAPHAAWYNAMGAPPAGRGIGSDYAAGPYDAAVAAQPPQEAPLRGLASGGHVADDEPVVVGEQGPETFVPDQQFGAAFHIPQPGKPGNIDRWPKIPAVGYPGRFGGVEREMRRQTRIAQDPIPGLADMVDSGRLRLTPNWNRMITDPSLIALGRSRMEDRRGYAGDYPY